MIKKLIKFGGFLVLSSTALIFCSTLVLSYFVPNSFYVDSNENLSFSSYNDFITVEPDFPVTKEVFNPENNRYNATAKLLGLFPIKEVSVTVTDEKIVTVCGSPFGVKLFTDGVLIVGFSKIDTENGSCCPAVDAGLLEGDLLKSIDGTAVFTNEDVAELIEESGGESLSMTVNRDGESVTVFVEPKLLSDKSGYKAGFWVRDSSAGIGTLTFYDPETMVFAGLGHAVCDVYTGSVIPFSSGEIVPAAITSVKKGLSGAPGELGGSFISTEELGTLKINSETGLYGSLEQKIKGISFPLAHKQDVVTGEAYILSTLNGTVPKEYSVQIESIMLSDNAMTKNMIIRVTDKELLEVSGGIVQGMSGSPIIQNGKLIGAVTHVFIGDPTKGYAIFAENMLEVSKNAD